MRKIDNATAERELARCKELIEGALDGYFLDDAPQKKLLEAIRYSMLAGGKRIRPVIALWFCAAVGGDVEKALPAACAVEMMHTYTLIHDDLPCMDDGNLRRGKPSNHIVYGESTAVLAGDALQAAAFEALLESELPAETVVSMVKVLAETAGAYGICGGQLLDMQGEEKIPTPDEASLVNDLKTATLLTGAAKLGVLAAGGNAEQLRAAEEYAMSVGRAFQLRDDILDYTATTEELGKPALSDATSYKTTLAVLLGVEKCEKSIREETEKAILAIEDKFPDTGFLVWIAKKLEERKY